MDGIIKAKSADAIPIKEPSGSREVTVKPRIYLNGFPKSGLHLAILMGRCLAHEPACDYAWASSFSLNAWSTQWLPDTKIYPNLARLQDNTWLKGHCGYRSEIEQYLFRHGVAKIFVYRDLRDVLVSQSYHVISEDGEKFYHPDKEMFRNMASHEDVMMACLTGAGPFSGLFERWELYAPWLWINWVHHLRYEDMVMRPEETARNFIQYVYARMSQVHGAQIILPDDILESATGLMLKAMDQKEASMTYRKGIVGGWREEFTPKIKDEFKRRCGRWLIELGYEEDDNW
ncbi:MAG: sulfotransferase domain-containing protein [Planctomycetota bacterium]|jgi:hypothetical protein